MNTYFEGVDIEWFKDYCQLSDHVESAWVNFSKQIIFNDKVSDQPRLKINSLNYSYKAYFN